MFQVFLVIQVIITAAMIGFILMQRTDSDGVSGLAGGGSANSFLTGRGTANFMTKTTSILAALFMINGLWLSVLAGKEHKQVSITDKIAQEEMQEKQVNKPSPAPQAVPAAEDAPLVTPKVDAQPVVPEPSPVQDAPQDKPVTASPTEAPAAH